MQKREAVAVASEKMTSSITIIYPDGTRQPVSKGSTAGEALALKGLRRSDEVIAALVNGKPMDLAYRLEATVCHCFLAPLRRRM